MNRYVFFVLFNFLDLVDTFLKKKIHTYTCTIIKYKETVETLIERCGPLQEAAYLLERSSSLAVT